jgi:2-polyprenyl-3-methyl-5-hydroxy-6-metoxy-1,4-benzoquinol methylase
MSSVYIWRMSTFKDTDGERPWMDYFGTFHPFVGVDCSAGSKDPQRYDVILLADTLWLADQHDALLMSCWNVLAPTGKIYVTCCNHARDPLCQTLDDVNVDVTLDTLNMLPNATGSTRHFIERALVGVDGHRFTVRNLKATWKTRPEFQVLVDDAKDVMMIELTPIIHF